MDKKKPEGYGVGKTYKFHCKAIPSPPGTFFKGKHLIPGEEPSLRTWWMVTAGGVAAALAAGILIGRFLIP